MLYFHHKESLLQSYSLLNKKGALFYIEGRGTVLLNKYNRQNGYTPFPLTGLFNINI
ncbi:hypothetical protein KP78_15030 [Jeotgalibacillus soli]|uniref:Uncharacterized protein n=1 Tax=Jeotgalibacillus soli TaxID=889306 RepID=A0A0C2RIR7_9BACL|nr:hypothetical protein KP78_15030 [Jeotgalibacillus soli]